MAVIPQKKIANLDPIVDTSLTDNDVLPIVSAGVTWKVTLANLALKIGTKFLPAGIVVSFANWISNNRTFNVKDYGAVGNGVANDTVAIQAAATAAIGATLVIPSAQPGQFYKITDKITLGSNILILGSGVAGELRQQTNETQTFYANAQSNITFRNVGLYGKGEFTNWTTLTHMGRGIDFQDCTDVKVLDCSIRNFAMSGVSLAGGKRFTVRGNRIQGTHSLGAPIGGIGERQFGVVVSTNIVALEDVDVSHNDVQGVCHAVNITTADRVVVSFNNAHDIPGEHAYYLGASDMVVSGNIARDFKDDGIKIYFGQVGTQRDVIVSDNLITSNRSVGNGINVGSSVGGGVLTDVTVEGNTIRNTSATPTTDGLAVGIAVSGISNVIVSDNKIRNPYTQGIYCDNTLANTDLTIDNNQISGHQQYAILANASTQTRTRITNNKISGGIAGQVMIYIGAAGDDIEVNNNIVNSPSSYSARVLSGPTNVKFKGNTFLGYGSAPVLVDSGAVVSVYENNNDNLEVSSYAASTTQTEWDRYVNVSAAGAARVFTLLSAVGRKGRKVTVVNVSGVNNVTITAFGAETISGAATLVLAAQWSKATIISDGANWVQVA